MKGFFCKLSKILWVSAAILLGRSSSAEGLQAAVALANYSKDAIGLFNNMRVPAALMTGGLVPLGVIMNKPIEAEEPRRTKVLKKAGALLGVASLLSEIIAVTYASIAINKLVELPSPDTTSVVSLISQHHELAWLGTNIHFLLGMMGFGLLVGIRVYLVLGESVGTMVAGMSLAFFFQSLAVVNRGISREINGVSSGFASNFGVLLWKYGLLILKTIRTGGMGVCGVLAVAAATVTVVRTAMSFARDYAADK